VHAQSGIRHVNKKARSRNWISSSISLDALRNAVWLIASRIRSMEDPEIAANVDRGVIAAG
jgi:hypothetical protein